MKTIAAISQKWGSGKSTAVVHLAVAAAIDGLRVLVLDLDPQGSVKPWWRRRQAQGIDYGAPDHKRLPEALKQAYGAGYQIVLIDTTAKLSALSVGAAMADDMILAPTQHSLFDVAAMSNTVEVIDQAGASARTHFLLSRCQPARGFARESARTREAINGLRSIYQGFGVCPVQTTNAVDYVDALNSGQSVVEFRPGGKPSAEIAALWAWMKEALS